MDLETTQTNVAAKLPLLKQGEYEIRRLRIEQYFQIQDYALWEVIENGNSFKPTQKKNDVKAKSMLLMELLNEHLLTFNQYKDAKTLFDAIQTRFGGNDAIKKTQKTLLKQMYENFNAPSTESLDSIFNRLQKINKSIKMIFEEWYDVELSLLSMRARRYYQRTRKKITINGSDTAGYDKSKVEYFNYHKMGHIARECRSPRNQESRLWNHDNGNRM
ncbi:ribonuclease H-like domain-containing protein [Tanacetum coccineum]